MSDYATAAIPLTNLTRKEVKFEWTAERQEGFDALKTKLTTFLCLVPPNWDIPFHVYCDASAVAVGQRYANLTAPKARTVPLHLLAGN